MFTFLCSQDVKCKTVFVAGFKATRLPCGQRARIWREDALKTRNGMITKQRHSESFALKFESEELLERCAL